MAIQFYIKKNIYARLLNKKVAKRIIPFATFI